MRVNRLRLVPHRHHPGTPVAAFHCTCAGTPFRSHPCCPTCFPLRVTCRRCQTGAIRPLLLTTT